MISNPIEYDAYVGTSDVFGKLNFFMIFPVV